MADSYLGRPWMHRTRVIQGRAVNGDTVTVVIGLSAPVLACA